jgi:hypothetical protein
MTIISEVKNFYSEDTRLGIVDFIDNDLHLYETNRTSDYTPANKDNHRSTWTDVPFFVEEHQRLRGLMEQVFNEPLIPTYSCLSRYNTDMGKLGIHIDRDQCYRTLSYMIRCDEAPNWPLYVGKWEVTDQEYAALQDHTSDFDAAPSDSGGINKILEAQEWVTIEHPTNSAAFFSGTHRWHYRDKIPTGSADVIMFHYNPA